MTYADEKIIHSRSMRDWLIEHGGILKKTKTDLIDSKREIYIFKESTIIDSMSAYIPPKNREVKKDG